MQRFPQAIFFDFDGVILESAEIKTEAFLELFNAYPDLLPAIHAHHIQHMGVSRFKKFEWIYANLIQQPLTQAKLQELGNRFSDIVLAKVLAAPFVPGAVELLQKLDGQCLCFVASGTPEEELRMIVNKRNLSSFFREVCGTPRTKSEIVHDLLPQYHVDIRQSWFIGDAQADWEAARTTGLRFIARKTKALDNFWNQQHDVFGVPDLLPLLNYSWPS